MAADLDSYWNHLAVESETPIEDWAFDGSIGAIVVDCNSCSSRGIGSEIKMTSQLSKIIREIITEKIFTFGGTDGLKPLLKC